MRVEYINPFVESAMSVLKSTVSENVKLVGRTYFYG